MWTVGELNLDYKRHNVGGSFGGLKNEDYKKLNPNLYIPTIKDGNFVLWESYAIIRYLSKKYGYGSLWPKDIYEAALADQWIEWFQEALMPKLFPIFWNKVRVHENNRDNNKIEEMINRGVKLQVNIGSIIGAYGPEVKKVADRLINDKVIDFVGSDCHHEQHLEMINHASRLPIFHSLIQQEQILNKSL